MTRVRRLLLSGAVAAMIVATIETARVAAFQTPSIRNHHGEATTPRTKTPRRPPTTAFFVGIEPGLRPPHGKPTSGRPSLQERFHAQSLALFASSSANNLASSYPEGTPPGLRGEAIRSALRSGRCLLYRWHHHDDDPSAALDCGLVQVRGNGTRAFLHSKLTRDFAKPAGASASLHSPSSSFQSACLLNGKGHVVDLIHVALVASPSGAHHAFSKGDSAGSEAATTTAFLLTSPGHSSTELFRRLDPFVFPMDQVGLRDCSPSSTPPPSGAGATPECRCSIFTVAALRRESIQNLFDRVLVPELRKWVRTGPVEVEEDFQVHLPAVGTTDTLGGAVFLSSPSADLQSPEAADTRRQLSRRPSLLIVPCSHLPECAVIGYTFYLWDDSDDDSGSASRWGSSLWNKLMDDADGPIHVGPREWETLRIEAGRPRYGTEFTGGLRKGGRKSQAKETTGAAEANTDVPSDKGAVRLTPADPLELHLDATLDLEKGCYLGQEGVASTLKNPRGPPRTLYQVVFEDESNQYDGVLAAREDDHDGGGESAVDNLTRPPAPGDALFVLGSNQEIAAGTITSVAEPGGTGESTTLGLALIPRADSILKRMADRDLSIPDIAARGGEATSPLPLSSRAGPLDGLEVIVGGTFTVGRLKAVPKLRYRDGENMFLDSPTDANVEKTERRGPIRIVPEDDEIPDDTSVDPWESDVPSALSVEVSEPELPSTERDEAQAAAEAEAKRKEEKMELLRKRAEDAMARRRSKTRN